MFYRIIFLELVVHFFTFPGYEAGEIVQWLKDEHELGHGHAMALFALFKGVKKEGDNQDQMHHKYLQTGNT